MQLNRKYRIFVGSILVVVVLSVALVIFYSISVKLNPPTISDATILQAKVKQKGDSLWVCKDSWLHQNTNGTWEMFITGQPFEMGVKNGKLTQNLASKQEKAFFDFIQSVVPSSSMLHFLKYFIAWFNKDLDEYVPVELQKEIYGVSLYASDNYDFIAPKYHRILNYHAAHDIGHTVQNMNLVACTALGVKGNKSENKKLLVGRNLDFSAGDAFAKEKIVTFCKPERGYAFMYVSWGGMIGVLSGMNEYGLTITLNSAKSDIPTSAKTPVSLVSRMILQYAKTIDEAYRIAKSYDTFVSEMFFISSAEDKTCAVIEKSLDKTALYQEKDNDLIVTNFFQSKELKDSPLNKEAIEEGSSMYRYKRVQELLAGNRQLSVQKMTEILRNQKGLENRNIGLGNEKAINQLICLHSVIFQPEDLLVWVSDYPYQLGEYKCYDLKKAFTEKPTIENIYKPMLNIPVDTFIHSKNYADFQLYKEKCVYYKQLLDKEEQTFRITNDEIATFIQLNPEYFYTYYIASLLCEYNNEKELALKYLKVGLMKEFPRVVDKELIENRIKSLEKK